MRKLILALLLLLPVCCFAQDIIVKKNGLNVVCRVIDINTSEVTYKKWTDLKGANYIMNISDISKINYADGRTMVFSDNTENEYAPGLQSEGQSQVSDNVLLSINQDIYENWKPTYKRLKRTAWIGGGIIICAGIATAALLASSNGEGISDSPYAFIAGGSVAVGAIWIGSFLYGASRYKNSHLNQMAQASPLWQKELRFNDGTSFSYGVDAVCDNLCKDRTFGFGLRYNF